MANPFVHVELVTTDVARQKLFIPGCSIGSWKKYRGWTTP